MDQINVLISNYTNTLQLDNINIYTATKLLFPELTEEEQLKVSCYCLAYAKQILKLFDGDKNAVG